MGGEGLEARGMRVEELLCGRFKLIGKGRSQQKFQQFRHLFR